MLKKVICLLLVISLALSLSVNAIAAQTVTGKQSSFTFIDANGKSNEIVILINDDGMVHVEHYIEGTFVNYTNAVLDDNEDVNFTTVYSNGTTNTYSESLSAYITEGTEILYDTRAGAYTYMGKINYNPYYDAVGNSHAESLSVYQQQTSTPTTGTKVLNAEAGTVFTAFVSILSLFFGQWASGLAEQAHQIAYEILDFLGVSVLEGIISKYVSTTCAVLSTAYSVRVHDYATSRVSYYDAEKYQIYLDGGTLSGLRYDGCMPWNSTSIAYILFSDFFGVTYPGVRSYA